jgi:predicted nucleic acid-binding Zn ribbon protein
MASRKQRDSSKNDPAGIGQILESMKAKTRLGKQLRQAQIWERWPELAGQYLCGHGHPLTVKDKTLHIEAYSAVWMHKFAYHKWDIIKRINAMAGQELVSDIFILLGDGAPAEPSQDGG